MIRGVYLILDPEQTAGRTAVAVAEAAIRGGVQAIQWRQKGGSLRACWTEIEQVRDLCQERGVRFLINDRMDVALAVGADGVHLGQDDLPLSTARQLLPNGIIGISVSNVAQAEPAVSGGADYLGIGPIYSTRSKVDAAAPLGPEAVTEIRNRTALPLVAIGGITVENAPAVRDAGADTLAVIAAIAGAPDMEAAARQLVRVMEQGANE